MDSAKIPQVIDESASIESPRRALLILGMHRSGTSALTRVLSLLGCALPGDLIPAAESNETGHWESAAVARLNDEILALAGSNWMDWLPLASQFAGSDAARKAERAAREVLLAEFGQAPLFVLKDPRICRLAPFWIEWLAREAILPAIVVPVRNPNEVARSLTARNGMEECDGLMLWLRHTLDAEAATRGLPRVFTSFQGLLTDWRAETDRIGRHLDLTWPRLSLLTAAEIDSFLMPQLRHHQAKAADAAQIRATSPWVAQAYEILDRWSVDGEDARDFASLDRLGVLFDEAGQMLLQPTLAARRATAAAAEAAAGQAAVAGERDRLQAERAVIAAECERLLASRDATAQERATEQAIAEGIRNESRHHAARAEAAQYALEHLERDRSHLFSRLADLQKDFDQSFGAAESRLRQREEQLAQAEANLARAVDARDASAETAANAVAARDLLIVARDKLAENCKELAQARDRLSRELADARVRASEALADSHRQTKLATGLQRALADVENGRARLVAEFADLRKGLEARLSAAGNALAQADEIRTADVEARARLQADRDEFKVRADALEMALAARTADIDQFRERLHEREAEAAARALDLNAETALREAAEATMADLQDALQASRQQLARGDADRARLATELATRVSAADSLSKSLQVARDQAACDAASSRRMAHIAAVIATLPAWWALLPESTRRRKSEARLLRAGLFDVEVYRTRYPDVAASPDWAVAHFLKHGISEGREWP